MKSETPWKCPRCTFWDKHGRLPRVDHELAATKRDLAEAVKKNHELERFISENGGLINKWADKWCAHSGVTLSAYILRHLAEWLKQEAGEGEKHE